MIASTTRVLLASGLCVLVLSSCSSGPSGATDNEDVNPNPNGSTKISVSGIVHDSNGDKVEGALIKLSSTENPPIPVSDFGYRTDTDGAFHVLLQPGGWEIIGLKDGISTTPVTIQAREDDLEVELLLEN